MAQKGTYAAYQRLRPIETDFAKQANEVADREQEARDRAAKEAAAREEKRAKLAKDFAADYSTLSEVVTNNRSIDEAFARGISSARDMTADLYKQIQRNPSLANDVNTQLKLQNLRNFSKNLKTVSDRYTDYAGKVIEGTENGTISSWDDDKLNSIDSIFRKMNLDVKPDPTTGLPVGVTALVDDNGDYIQDENGGIELENMNLIEVLNGQGLGELTGVYNLAKEAQKIGPDLGRRAVKKADGSFSHYQYELFEDIEGSVRDLVRGAIGDYKNPTSVAKSIWADTLGESKKELTEQDMARIEDVYVNTIRAFYDEKAERTTDFGARNAAGRLALDRKKAAGDEDVEEASPFTVVTDQDFNIVKRDFEGVATDLRGPAIEFDLPVSGKNNQSEATVVGRGGRKVLVDRVYLLDSGELAYQGYEMRGKVTGEEIDPEGLNTGKVSYDDLNRVDGGGADPRDPVLTNVAKMYGFRNEGELKRHLQEQANIAPTANSNNNKREDLRKKYNY